MKLKEPTDEQIEHFFLTIAADDALCSRLYSMWFDEMSDEDREDELVRLSYELEQRCKVLYPDLRYNGFVNKIKILKNMVSNPTL